MEGLAQFILSIAAQFPIVNTIVYFVVGAAVIIPMIWAVVTAFIKVSKTKKDDLWLAKVEGSTTYKVAFKVFAWVKKYLQKK